MVASADMADLVEVCLRVLGMPRVERSGLAVAMDTRKAVALLSFLTLEPRPHSRDALAALLWPEYDQTHARATLRRTLSTLVTALGDTLFDAGRETLRLRADAPIWVDAIAFQTHLAAVRAHKHPANAVCPACREALTAAVALYQDDLLAGFHLRDSAPFEDWLFTQRQVLRRALGVALAQLTQDAIAAHAFDVGLGYAQRWLALDPLHEQAHRFLMRLYAWTGQQSAALRQYRACLQVLDQELGVAPLDVTTRLYEAIKQRRLPAPPARTETETSEPPEAPARHSTSASISPSRVGSSGTTVSPLIGRTDDLRRVLDAYRASATAGHLMVVEGEAGIGKTRLAEELLAHARAGGATILVGRCYAGETTLAYAPIVMMLRAATAVPDQPTTRPLSLAPTSAHGLSEAARLIPDLRERYPHLPPAPAPESAGAQVRFFEGIRQVLLDGLRGPKPGVLFIDDVQWADAASLDLLAYLVRRLGDHAVCLLLTWRGTDVAPTSSLRRMLADAERAGNATSLRLERLDRAAIHQWVDGALGSAAEREVAEHVYAETEGVPLFVEEYVRALASGALAATDPRWSMPGSVHNLLHSRLGAVDDTSLQVLTAAAILGRSFDFDTVREVSGRSAEETLDAVESLGAQGLVTELSGGTSAIPRYDFAHDKLRALVLEQTSLARRRLLHRRAAAALEQSVRHGHDDATIAGQIAQHALAAGDTQSAAQHFQRAGDRARALYAHADALRYYEQAHALGVANPAALHEAMGDVLLMLANYSAAITSYELAAASAAPQDLWRIELKLGRVYARRGEWAIAESSLESAFARIDALPGASPAERSAVCAEWSLVARRSGRVSLAQELAARALALAEEASDDHALARAHNILGMLARGNGETAEAIAHLERSLALAEHLADPGARAAALNNLALALGESGERARAIAAAEAALALAVTQGDRHHEAALHNNLADLLHAGGQTDDAMRHLTQAVGILAEIGDEGGTLQPGIWMLTDW